MSYQLKRSGQGHGSGPPTGFVASSTSNGFVAVVLCSREYEKTHRRAALGALSYPSGVYVISSGRKLNGVHFRFFKPR